MRRALSDETQRAALLELLQDLLPPDDAAPDDAGARWHPLLERDGPGNVYLTVEGDVIGVAAAIATDGAEPPLARAGIRLPLVQAGEDDLRAVAGTATAPWRWSSTPNGGRASTRRPSASGRASTWSRARGCC